MSPLGISATFPMVRFASAARRVAPIEGPSRFTLALESIGSGTGQLVEDPWVEPSTPGNLYEPDDILYGKLRPYLAKVWVADRAGNYVGDFIRITARSSFDSQFLKYVILTPSFISEASAGSVGSKMPRTEWDTLKQIQIPAPRLEQQQQIADYLDHETAEIDAFIGNQKQLRALISLRSQTLLETTIKHSSSDTLQLRRLKPTRQSGTSVNAGSRRASDGELGVLKTGAASKGYFDATENKAVTEDGEIARLTTPVVKDRVLVNRANTPDLVGTAVYVPDDYPELYLSDKLWIVDFDASNEFLALALSTRCYREQVSQFVVGASSSMQNLSYGDFLSIRVPVPSRESQNQVVAALRSSIRATRVLGTEISKAIDLARERRAALITAAVTGQIDVTAKNKPAAEQLEDDIAQGLHREHA